MGKDCLEEFRKYVYTNVYGTCLKSIYKISDPLCCVQCKSDDSHLFPSNNQNQHGIRVKGRLPSMLKAAMKVAAGTAVEFLFCEFNVGGMET